MTLRSLPPISKSSRNDTRIDTRIDRQQLKKLLPVSVLVFFMGMMLRILVVRHWSDSEIWGVRQGAACFWEWNRYACSWKPGFNMLVGVMNSWALHAPLAAAMVAPRMLTGLAWFGCAAIFWFRHRSWLVLIAFLGSSIFLLDSTVARPDFWALPFILIFAGEFLRPGGARGLLILGAAVVAALLTPKSIVPLVCMGPLALPTLRQWWKEKSFGWQEWALVLVALLAVVLTVDVWRTFLFFTHLFTFEDYGIPYWDSLRFFYLRRLFVENPHLLVLVAFLLFLLVIHSRRSAPLRRILVSSLLVLAAMLLFPDKLPFFLSTCLVLFLFLGASVVDEFALTGRWIRGVLGTLAAFAVVNGIHWSAQIRGDYRNDVQKEMLQELDRDVAGLPYVRLFDSLGLTAVNELPGYFLGPGQAAANQQILKDVGNEKYDVILITHKLKSYEDILRREQAGNYVEFAPGLWGRTIEFKVEQPRRAGREILNALSKELAPHLGANTRLRIFIQDGSGSWSTFLERSFQLEDLDSLPPLCASCQSLVVRVTPFGGLLNFRDQPFGQAGFEQQFRFEPEVSRLSLWQFISR